MTRPRASPARCATSPPPPLPPTLVSRIHGLGAQVRAMLRGALEAFARTDPEEAARWRAKDRELDLEAEALMRELFTYVLEHDPSIARTNDVFTIARALQRIGDHACNICEYVIYLAKGRDVRHVSPEMLARAAARRQD